MATVIENVQKNGNDLLVQVEIFLYAHSTIESPPYNDRTCAHTGMGSFCKWGKLEEVGLQEQARLLQKCNVFFSVLEMLLSGQTASCRKEVGTAKAEFRELIKQEKRCQYESIDYAVQAAKKPMGMALSSLSQLYDGKSGEVCYVPDTNALLYNTQLDEWQFDGVPTFTVVLTPTVLSELDDLKVRGNDEVQPKAEKLVGQIEEYAHRGDLREGVTLAEDRSVVRLLATEPDMARTLSWLDAGSKDDRLIASFLEVMRHHPGCEVVLVSRERQRPQQSELCLASGHRPARPSLSLREGGDRCYCAHHNAPFREHPPLHRRRQLCRRLCPLVTPVVIVAHRRGRVGVAGEPLDHPHIPVQQIQ